MIPQPDNDDDGDALVFDESFGEYAYQRLSEHQGLGIGLAGAHRVGKSTLAKALTKDSSIPFVSSSTSAIAAATGFDINDPNVDFVTRLAFQEIVLDHFERDYEKQTGLFVSDRTPLDAAAYLMADVQQGDIGKALDDRINAYIDRAMKLANKHFVATFVVQPGIPYVVEPGKPLPNRAYQEKVATLIMGLARTYIKRNFLLLDRSLRKHDDRVRVVATQINGIVADYYSMLNTLPRI